MSQSGSLNLSPIEAAALKLDKQVQARQLPGYLALVVHNGTAIFSKECGVGDLCSQHPLKMDSLVRLYSQTKPVTICAFMRMLEKGLVSLEDPLMKYIPAFAKVKVCAGRSTRPPRRPILLHDLLAHTSGIGFGPGFGYEPENEYERTYAKLVKKIDTEQVTSLAQWCAELAKLPLRFDPGKDWGYGYSSDLLGRVIEVVSGRSLDEYLRTEVLEPLGMHDTSFAVTQKKLNRLTALYKRDPWDGAGSKVRFFTCDAGGSGLVSDASRRVSPDPGLLSGTSTSSSAFLAGGRACRVLQGGGCVGSVAGGLVSTLKDWQRLGQMLLNEGELDGVRILQEDTVRLLRRDWLNDFRVDKVKRRRPLWVWGTPGIGFSPLGQIGVKHPEAKGRRGVGAALDTVHWGGAGGSGFMISWPKKILALTYTGCTYDTATQKAMWAAALRAVPGDSDAGLKQGQKRPAAGDSVIPDTKRMRTSKGDAEACDSHSLRRRPASLQHV